MDLKKYRLLLAFYAVSLFSPKSSAQEYNLTRILPEGWTNSHVTALNESGHILLETRVGDQQWETYLWRGPGDLEQIGTQTEKSVSGFSLNDNDEVLVGIRERPSGTKRKWNQGDVHRPYFWSKEIGMVPLVSDEWVSGLLEQEIVHPRFINNRREVVVWKQAWANGSVYSGSDESLLFRAEFEGGPSSYELSKKVKVKKFGKLITALNENGSVLMQVEFNQVLSMQGQDYPLDGIMKGNWLPEDTFLNDQDEFIGFCSKRDIPNENPAKRHGFYVWSTTEGLRIKEVTDPRLAWHIHARAANNKGEFLLVDSKTRPEMPWKTWSRQKISQINWIPHFVRNGILRSPEPEIFLWNGKEVIDLKQFFNHDPGWSFDNIYYPREINDKGQILGKAKYKGTECAYLLTPVEE